MSDADSSCSLFLPTYPNAPSDRLRLALRRAVYSATDVPLAKWGEAIRALCSSTDTMIDFFKNAPSEAAADVLRSASVWRERRDWYHVHVSRRDQQLLYFMAVFTHVLEARRHDARKLEFWRDLSASASNVTEALNHLLQLQTGSRWLSHYRLDHLFVDGTFTCELDHELWQQLPIFALQPASTCAAGLYLCAALLKQHPDYVPDFTAWANGPAFEATLCALTVLDQTVVVKQHVADHCLDTVENADVLRELLLPLVRARTEELKMPHSLRADLKRSAEVLARVDEVDGPLCDNSAAVQRELYDLGLFLQVCGCEEMRAPPFRELQRELDELFFEPVWTGVRALLNELRRSYQMREFTHDAHVLRRTTKLHKRAALKSVQRDLPCAPQSTLSGLLNALLNALLSLRPERVAAHFRAPSLLGFAQALALAVPAVWRCLDERRVWDNVQRFVLLSLRQRLLQGGSEELEIEVSSSRSCLEESVAQLDAIEAYLRSQGGKEPLYVHFGDQSESRGAGLTNQWFALVAAQLRAEGGALELQPEAQVYHWGAACSGGSALARRMRAFVAAFLRLALLHDESLGLPLSRLLVRQCLLPHTAIDEAADYGELDAQWMRSLQQMAPEELLALAPLSSTAPASLTARTHEDAGRRVYQTRKRRKLAQEETTSPTPPPAPGPGVPDAREVERARRALQAEKFRVAPERLLGFAEPESGDGVAGVSVALLQAELRGRAEVDVAEWVRHVQCKSLQHRAFLVTWMSANQPRLRQLLRFVTAHNAFPAEGPGALKPPLTLVVHENLDAAHLPRAQTCFHQLFVPAYESYEMFAARLERALDETDLDSLQLH